MPVLSFSKERDLSLFLLIFCPQEISLQDNLFPIELKECVFCL